jgi:histidyl-tRNA synthetase
VNPRLVRGLDYYNKTVFEWVTDALGAQGTVCAGGRYDGLFEQLGGRPTPGVGFAMGVERLVLMLHECAALPAIPVPALYAVALGDDAQRAALRAVEDLRRDLPGMTILMGLGGGSFRSQMKRADKSGAQVALLWGDDEVANAEVTLKPLRGEAAQRRVPVAGLARALQPLLAPGA